MEEIAKRFLELANNPEIAENVNFVLAFLIGTYFLMYFSLSLIDFLHESAYYFYHRRNNHIADNSIGMKKEDLSIKYWCYDNRIEKDVFMVSTNRFGKDNYIKKYGCTQFAGYYLIEL